MGIWNTNLLTLIKVPNMVSLITSARPMLKIKLSAGVFHAGWYFPAF